MSIEIITINVGGTLVQTSRTTLENFTYFQKIFQGDFKKTELFLDADYEIFRHILNRARSANYVYPADQEDNINAMHRYLMLEPEPEQEFKTPSFFILRHSDYRYVSESIDNHSIATYAVHPGMIKYVFINIIMKSYQFARLKISLGEHSITVNATDLYNYFKLIGEGKRQAFEMRGFMLDLINECMGNSKKVSFCIEGDNATLDCLIRKN